MEWSVPYRSDLQLASILDKNLLKVGECLKRGEESLTINKTEICYSMSTSLKEVCTLLRIPPEYALKVKAEEIKDGLVASCIESLHYDNTFSIIFRVSYLQKNQLFLNLTTASESQVASSESGTKTPQQTGEYYVASHHVGNEIITIMKITSDDDDMPTAFQSFNIWLSNSSGELKVEKLQKLLKLAEHLDKQIIKDRNKLTIKYFCFNGFPKYPNNVRGMFQTILTFVKTYEEWKVKKHHRTIIVDKAMICHFGEHNDETPTNTTLLSHFFGGKNEKSCQSKVQRTLEVAESSNVDQEELFYLCVTLRKLVDDYNVHVQDSQDHHLDDTFEKMFEQIIVFERIIDLFRMYEARLHLKVNRQEGEHHLKKIKTLHKGQLQTIKDVQYRTKPRNDTMSDFHKSLDVKAARMFVENLVYKIPQGDNLTILLMGKTGHGKSSTGNTILGREAFQTSNKTTSMTTEPSVESAEIDKRKITVVDTPGVYDTEFSSTDEMIDACLRSMSDVIARLPEGIHALIIVIRIKIKLTKEEQKAIRLLKEILGNDVIKKQCICVFTYGDEFEEPFLPWCHRESGFLKTLLEECSYRCVLINNKNPSKNQLIELITMIDKMRVNSRVYTMELFEMVKKERDKYIEAEKITAIKVEVLESLNEILAKYNSIKNTKDEPLNDEQLSELESAINDFKKKVEGKNELKRFYDIIVKLSDTIKRDKLKCDQHLAHTMKDLAAYHQELKEEVEIINKRTSNAIYEKIKETGCFPMNSKVYLLDGRCVYVNELQAGDKVMTRNSSGRLAFDTVYMLGHRDYEAFTEFVAIETVSNKISLTPGHYIYCKREGQELCLAAENVRIGDEVFVVVDDNCVSCPVWKITLERKQGLFAPFTNSGNIVVDGVLASCYINILQPSVCHELMWPVRLLFKLSPRTLSYINGLTAGQHVPKWALFMGNFLNKFNNKLL